MDDTTTESKSTTSHATLTSQTPTTETLQSWATWAAALGVGIGAGMFFQRAGAGFLGRRL